MLELLDIYCLHMSPNMLRKHYNMRPTFQSFGAISVSFQCRLGFSMNSSVTPVNRAMKNLFEITWPSPQENVVKFQKLFIIYSWGLLLTFIIFIFRLLKLW